MHHLGTSIAQVLDGECYGTLHTIQVIVNTQTLKYKQRSRHAAQAELRRQVLLEEFFNQFDTLFRLFRIYQTFIVYGLN